MVTLSVCSRTYLTSQYLSSWSDFIDKCFIFFQAQKEWDESNRKEEAANRDNKCMYGRHMEVSTRRTDTEPNVDCSSSRGIRKNMRGHKGHEKHGRRGGSNESTWGMGITLDTPVNLTTFNAKSNFNS